MCIHSNPHALSAIRYTSLAWPQLKQLPYSAFLDTWFLATTSPIVIQRTYRSLWLPIDEQMHMNILYSGLVFHLSLGCGKQSHHGFIAIWSTCHSCIIWRVFILVPHVSHLPGHLCAIQLQTATKGVTIEPKGTALRHRTIPLDWLMEMYGNGDYGIWPTVLRYLN